MSELELQEGQLELQGEQGKLEEQGQENQGRSKRGKRKKGNNLIETDSHNIDYENLTWEFDNVLELTRYGEKSKYVAVIDLFTLGECYKNNLIYYRSSVQRGSKLDKKNNEVPIFKLSKVKDIINAILSDPQWHGGSIILNTDVSIDELEYDSDLKTLKGHGRLFPVDGNHRLISAKRLYDLYNKGKIIQNPRDYQIVCIIDASDELGASKIFAEHNLLPWKPPKSRSAFLQIDKLENIIARNIMKSSEIKGRVETISSNPKGNNVITFNTLISGIEYLKPQTLEQAEVLSNNLIEYVNIIVNIFPEILGVVDKATRDENRKLIYAGEPMFLEAFFAAYPVLVGKDNMIERLKSLRKVIKIGNQFRGEVLSRTNPIWIDNITIGGKTVNKRSTKSFVINTIKEYLDSGKLPVEYEIVE